MNDNTYTNPITTEETMENIKESAKAILDINESNNAIARQNELQYQKEQEQRERERQEKAKRVKQRYLDAKVAAEQKRRREFEEELKRRAEEEAKAQESKRQGFRLFGKQKGAEEESTHKDELTGLYTYEQYEIDSAKINFTGKTCLICVGLNDYQYAVNNHYEDKLVKELASALTRTFHTPHLYRLSEDEFAVLWYPVALKEVVSSLEKFHTMLANREKKLSRKDAFYLSAVTAYALHRRGDSKDETWNRVYNEMQEQKTEFADAHADRLISDMEEIEEMSVAQPEPEMEFEVVEEEDTAPEVEELEEMPDIQEEELEIEELEPESEPEPAPVKKSKPTPKKQKVSKKKSKQPVQEKPGKAIMLPAYHEDTVDEKEDQIAPYMGAQSEDFEVSVPVADQEYISWRDQMAASREKINTMELGAMIEEIQRFKDKIVALALVTDDMKTLLLLRTPDEFFNVVNRQEYDIMLSYIYVIYTDHQKYYLKKPKDKYLASIFESIRELFMNNTMVTGKMLAQLPNMAIFNDIYIS